MKNFFLAKAVGLSENELSQAFLRASRLEEAFRPDGAKEYVPLTTQYASRNLIGRKTLRRLEGE